MASSSPKRSAKCHVRSISLPTISHPASLKIVEEINKLRSSDSTTGSARSGLAGLEELYEATNEFLVATSTRDAISSKKSDGSVDELLDGLVRLLDAFHLTRDLVSQIKERARDVQSVIRRRNPDPSNIEEVVADFTRFKKKFKKGVKKVTAGVKWIETEFMEISVAADQDRAFFSAMTLLREVVALSCSILQPLLSNLDNTKDSKWGILSKFVHKGAIAIANNGNEFEALDDAVLGLSNDVSIEKVKITQDQLRDLEIGIAHIEDDLDGLYRRLIRTRVSLLNIISQ